MSNENPLSLWNNVLWHVMYKPFIQRTSQQIKQQQQNLKRYNKPDLNLNI